MKEKREGGHTIVSSCSFVDAKPGQNYKANMAKLQSQLQNMVLRIPTYI